MRTHCPDVSFLGDTSSHHLTRVLNFYYFSEAGFLPPRSISTEVYSKQWEAGVTGPSHDAKLPPSGPLKITRVKFINGHDVPRGMDIHIHD
ncbi:hypothetical protein AAC387_Pa01g3359 [Persea americana]